MTNHHFNTPGKGLTSAIIVNGAYFYLKERRKLGGLRNRKERDEKKKTRGEFLKRVRGKGRKNGRMKPK